MTRFQLEQSKRIGSLLDFAAISLGKLRPDYSVDRGPRPEGMSYSDWDKARPKKMEYPSLWVSDRDQSLKLPQKGTALVKYRVKRHSVTNEIDNGKASRRESADIEIQSIDPNVSGRAKKLDFGIVAEAMSSKLTPEERKKKMKESGGTIRKISHLVGLSSVTKPFKIDLEAVQSRVSFETVSRNRNSGGQFAPGQQAADADTFAVALGKKKPQPNEGAVKPGSLTAALPALSASGAGSQA